MRYQQKIRKSNKTARQEFEYDVYRKHFLEQKHLRAAVQYLKASHKTFVGGLDQGVAISRDSSLDWSTFFKQADGVFYARLKSNQIVPKGKGSRQWKHLINTFKNAVHRNDVALYKKAISMMNLL